MRGGRRFVWGRPKRRAAATVVGVAILQASANGGGGLLVWLYLSVLFPADTGLDDANRASISAAVFGAYILVTVAAAIPFNRYVLGPVVRWLAEGRPPSDDERLAALAQPWRQTVSAFVTWMGAAFIFGALNSWVFHEPGAKRVAVGIVLAGATTCAVLYALLQRYFRPVFVLALEGAPAPAGHGGIRVRLMLAWLLGAGLPLLGIALLPIGLSERQFSHLSLRITVLAATGFLVGGVIMRTSVRAVSDPVDEVRRAMQRVEDGDLDVRVAVYDAGDVGRLQAGFNEMVSGLRERQRLQDLFGRHVGRDVARHALEHGVEIGGERREVTALFVDLERFTGYAEANDPEDVVTTLNIVFGIVVDVVMDRGGWVDKFEGDAALCVFGAPTALADHATRGLDAAAELHSRLSMLPGIPRAGIGVASGTVVAGNVGNERRHEYTVIGDAVNVASRLSDLAKARDVPLLVDATTLARAESELGSTDGKLDEWSPAGTEQLRGRSAPTPVFTFHAPQR